MDYELGQPVETRCLIVSGCERLGNRHERHEWIEARFGGFTRSGRLVCTLGRSVGHFKAEDVRPVGGQPPTPVTRKPPEPMFDVPLRAKAERLSMMHNVQVERGSLPPDTGVDPIVIKRRPKWLRDKIAAEKAAEREERRNRYAHH